MRIMPSLSAFMQDTAFAESSHIKFINTFNRRRGKPLVIPKAECIKPEKSPGFGNDLMTFSRLSNV
jgi:hypothetical protein